MRDPDSEGGDLARFEGLVFEDEALQHALSRILDEAEFVDACVEAGAARGLAVPIEPLRRRLLPDPLGLSRLFDAAPVREEYPRGDWLPTGVSRARDAGLLVEWTHFGGAALQESFFRASAQRAQARPFNRAFRCSTRLALGEEGRAPDGLIFHQSRCGSTAVARMLAALPGATCLSEPAAVESLIQQVAAGLLTGGHAVAALRSLFAALARRAERTGGPFFVKLDAWHSLSLPLFRAAFPTTRWAFLFREPLEILVSQARERGPQTIPELMDPSRYGLPSAEGLASEDYCARVVARTGEAALEHRALGGGLFVDFVELPGAVAERILPHFGVEVAPEDRAALIAAAATDAKGRDRRFHPDAEAKSAVGGALRALADAQMRSTYERLAAAAREGSA